jgi:mannose-6-phosphate isomerase-like protein (cupin superfamily)
MNLGLCATYLTLMSFLQLIPVVGMGLSSWVTHEFRRKRVWEHVRLAFFSWLYDNEDEEKKLADKFRKPIKVEDLEGEPMHDAETDSCGVRRELLSPDWALTSNLNVTVLALPSGTELVAKKAKGVEFYYVIKGEGDYSSGEDTSKITSGTGFVVDPGW